MLGVILAAAAATAPVPALTSDWWSDYYDTPSKGLAPGELSVVVAEITVNKNGYFAGCTGHTYTGNPKMGPYVCSRLQMRAGFEPAHGPDGRKVIGVYRKLIIVANVTKTTSFRMPSIGIHVPGPASSSSENPFEIQFYLDANGQVSDCSLIDSSGSTLIGTSKSWTPRWSNRLRRGRLAAEAPAATRQERPPNRYRTECVGHGRQID